MQNLVKDFNDRNNRSASPLPVEARLMDIQSEMGELVKEYLKGSDYGTSDFVLSEDFKLELGDVLYSILSLSCELNINATEELTKVINKYQSRIDKKKTMGSEAEE